MKKRKQRIRLDAAVDQVRLESEARLTKLSADLRRKLKDEQAQPLQLLWPFKTSRAAPQG